MQTNPEKALVVFSGGQDSTTVLAYAMEQHADVHAIAFAYDQKHAVELVCAHKIAQLMEVPLTVVRLDALTHMRSSALVSGGDVAVDHAYLENRPASFVPARNAMFLTAAWGYAMELGASAIYTGVCETDYSGYPDCRDAFIRTLQNSLSIGYEVDIRIHTPLMKLNKADTFQLAENLDVLRIVIEESHTCYNGMRTPHDWGAGCGTCPACTLRSKGWVEYQARKRRGDAKEARTDAASELPIPLNAW